MIWRIAGAALVMAVSAAILSELGFRSKRAYAALAITVLLCFLTESVTDPIFSIVDMAEGAGVGTVARVALKVVGVGYIYGYVSDIAEELGERGIATAVTSVGRAQIFILVLPYLVEILSVGAKLAS